MLAVGGHTFGDLGGQLPGWGQYQSAYLVIAGGLAGAQALQQGRVNPAVLPVPVWAAAITSRPLSTAGMAWAWIGDGV